MFTTQKQIRVAFWECYGAGYKRIPDHSGTGKMYDATTRSAFCDYVDCLQKTGQISYELAERVTL